MQRVPSTGAPDRQARRALRLHRRPRRALGHLRRHAAQELRGAVKRGHVSLLSNSDTGHPKRLRSIGCPLIIIFDRGHGLACIRLPSEPLHQGIATSRAPRRGCSNPAAPWQIGSRILDGSFTPDGAGFVLRYQAACRATCTAFLMSGDARKKRRLDAHAPLAPRFSQWRRAEVMAPA